MNDKTLTVTVGTRTVSVRFERLPRNPEEYRDRLVSSVSESLLSGQTSGEAGLNHDAGYPNGRSYYPWRVVA